MTTTGPRGFRISPPIPDIWGSWKYTLGLNNPVGLTFFHPCKNLTEHSPFTLGHREKSGDPAEIAGFPAAVALACPSGDVLPETAAVCLELRDGASKAGSVEVGAVAGVVDHRHDGNVAAVVELVHGGSILKEQAGGNHRIMQDYLGLSANKYYSDRKASHRN